MSNAVREKLESEFDQYLLNLSEHVRGGPTEVPLDDELAKEVAAEVIVRAIRACPTPETLDDFLLATAEKLAQERAHQVARAREQAPEQGWDMPLEDPLASSEEPPPPLPPKPTASLSPEPEPEPALVAQALSETSADSPSAGPVSAIDLETGMEALSADPVASSPFTNGQAESSAHSLEADSDSTAEHMLEPLGDDPEPTRTAESQAPEATSAKLLEADMDSDLSDGEPQSTNPTAPQALQQLDAPPIPSVSPTTSASPGALDAEAAREVKSPDLDSISSSEQSLAARSVAEVDGSLNEPPSPMATDEIIQTTTPSPTNAGTESSERASRIVAKSRTNPGASLPPVAASDAIDDEIGMLSLAGYPNNPLRAARLCVTAAADELGLEPATVLQAAAGDVARALQSLLDARAAEPDRFPVQRLHVDWQRTARKETLRALFKARS